MINARTDYRIWQDASDDAQRDAPTNLWYRVARLAGGHLGDIEGPFQSREAAEG